MVGYSSDRFYKEWRFDIDVDFVDGHGKPFKYADNGKQEWGDELKRLPFATEPTLTAINHDHSVLAVAVGHEIYLYEALSSSFQAIACLQGHVSRVDSIAFQPNHPNTLVSCAMNSYGGSVPTDPTIILWNIEKVNEQFQVSNEGVARLIEDAKTTIAQGLESFGLKLDPLNERHLRRELKIPIVQTVCRAHVADNNKLYGRLTRSFDSRVFSNSGRHLIYMPGKAPRSNGDDKWDIRIYSVGDNKDDLTLSGHRDAIMWTGYDKEDRYIGSVSWDRTSRIWDAATGELKHTFHSNGQNWTGAFSPDGERFAFACGDGTIMVHSLNDGNEIYKHKFGFRWHRTLAWSSFEKNWLAIGGQGLGDLRLVDIEAKKTIQHRALSTARAKTDDTHRPLLGGFLETNHVKFVNGGKKLVFFTTGDGSAEIYDLGRNRKWRFARAGTDSYPDEDDSGSDQMVTSRGGFDLTIWEDVQSSDLFIATVDGDAVRVWRLSQEC